MRMMYYSVMTQANSGKEIPCAIYSSLSGFYSSSPNTVLVLLIERSVEGREGGRKEGIKEGIKEDKNRLSNHNRYRPGCLFYFGSWRGCFLGTGLPWVKGVHVF